MFVYKKIGLLLLLTVHCVEIAMNRKETHEECTLNTVLTIGILLEELKSKDSPENRGVYTIGADLQHGGKYVAITEDRAMLLHSLAQLKGNPRQFGRGSSEVKAKL